MAEQQRVTWLLSKPASSEVNKAMQELTGAGVNYNTGEQNKDTTRARQDRDWKDTNTVLKYIQERSPFTQDTTLQNICTGVNAHCTVNVDSAKSTLCTVYDIFVCRKCSSSWHGREDCCRAYIKRNDQAVTLDTKSAVKIDGATVQIDPRLLFQRLTVAAKAIDNLEAVFKYELCSYPPALFGSSLLLREPQKTM